MTPSNIIVVGGGFAGVAAAASLRAAGASVTLLDDRATLGGRARSDGLEGVTIETGAQLIASSFTRTLALLGAPVLSTDAPLPHPGAAVLRRSPGRDTIARGGARHAVQFGSVRSLLGFHGLGPMEKLKLGRHLLPLLARHHAQLGASADRIPAALDGTSARAFVAEHISERAADMLVEPALNVFYAARGDEASLGFYLAVARYGSESDLLTPTAGWGTLLERALRGARHEAGVRVLALEEREGGWDVHADDGRCWRGDGVVLATGPAAARALLAPLATDDVLLRWLGAADLRPTLTLAVAVDHRLLGETFGVFSDSRTAHFVSACAVHSAKASIDAPADRDVVLAWPTPARAAELTSRPSEQVAAAMLPEIEELLPAVRGHVTRARVYRFEAGTPLAHPGFVADRARGRELVRALTPPITLAGDYLTMPLVEGAVASGEWAAKLLLGKLAARTASTR